MTPWLPVDLTPSKRLTPADAAAAILHTEDGQYLLQQRDANPSIFYPGHWGCFGGALENGESPMDALRRELMEELQLDLGGREIRLFSHFRFSVEPVGIAELNRYYYEIRIGGAEVEGLRLDEGAAMGLLDGREALHAYRLVPYDAFMLWLHVHQRMLGSGGRP